MNEAPVPGDLVALDHLHGPVNNPASSVEAALSFRPRAAVMRLLISRLGAAQERGERSK